MSKWKMQSEQLRAALRNNRVMADAKVCESVTRAARLDPV